MSEGDVLNLITLLRGDIDTIQNNRVGAIHFRYIYNEREANVLFNSLEDRIRSVDNGMQTQIRRIRSHASRLQGDEKKIVF